MVHNSNHNHGIYGSPYFNRGFYEKKMIEDRKQARG
jgi:hypothetical protein